MAEPAKVWLQNYSLKTAVGGSVGHLAASENGQVRVSGLFEQVSLVKDVTVVLYRDPEAVSVSSV